MKRLIIGIIIGLTLGMATNAFAAVGDTVSAVFADFKYMVNGEAKTLDSPVLVYDGNSYLRTTQISNMLGFDVTYKADTRTIEFDNPSAMPTTTTPSEPVASPVTTPAESTPPPAASPTPTPGNTVACQAIRDKYSGQIAGLNYKGLTQGQMALQKLQLEYSRDQELSGAGCQ